VSSIAEVDAPAKVNLRLRVFDARPDRFHELETLFQAVDLADKIRVEAIDGPVELEVHGADLGATQENLAYRAATMLLRAVAAGSGARVTLTKHIPVGAGLGGGSSDAAAVLKCLAALLGIDGNGDVLRRIGAELGSDVPFFLGRSPLAVGRGRGEVLEPFAPLPEGHLVLVSPPVHVSTGWAYGRLDAARRARGDVHGRSLRGRPGSWADVAAEAYNDFQDVVAAEHPQVARAVLALSSAGAEVALMSGSGSTSFGIFETRDAAERAAHVLSVELGWP
jgi:4-diphosphocytidyl-2-C-methyl-D-erythritol kinase